MAYQYWSYETLHRFCMDAFQKFGFDEKEADIIQDVLLTSDLYGIESHGMQRIARYHNGIKKGLIINADGYIKGSDGTMEDVEWLFIPYYAWNNRGEGEMSVWVRV